MSLKKRRSPHAKQVGKYKSELEYVVRRGMPKPKGVKVAYESESIPYSVPGLYNPDFVVTLPSGRKFYIEVKGWFRMEDRKKMHNVLLSNPGLDIRMVFAKKSKRDERWCIKHNVPYAWGSVPKEWFDE